MPEHQTATREEWQAARDELAKLEAEHAELGERFAVRRRRAGQVADKAHELEEQAAVEVVAGADLPRQRRPRGRGGGGGEPRQEELEQAGERLEQRACEGLRRGGDVAAEECGEGVRA